MGTQLKPGIMQPALILAALCFCLLPARSASTDTPEQSKYIGPGSCAATSCHGSVKPVAGSRIYQNEYSTWILQDKHSRAYGALTGEVGERMARILKLESKAEEAPKCLACHALYTTAEQRGRPFELAEGVSCENCHGPASAWLGPHTTRDWPHEKSVALGMHDTRNVIHRTEKCLECHLGTKNKFVDHEMIAAGHPDLYFELDSFSAVMPRHWKVPRESAPGKPAEEAAWTGVRDWGTGQAIQLRGEMDRLVWRARNERLIRRMPGRNIRSFPALRATTRWVRRRKVGARRMVTKAAARVIRLGTRRATRFSVCSPSKSILGMGRSWTSTC